MSRRISMTVLACSLLAACGAADRDRGPDAGSGKTDDPGGGGGDGDDVTDCPGVPCDLYQQCGCGEGEACDLAEDATSVENTTCRPAGAGTGSATCDGPEDCAPGYVCEVGQCWRWCEGDADCGEHSYCLSAWADVVGASTCTKSCKPESPDDSGCPEGMACRYYLHDPNGAEEYDGDEFEYTDCNPAGEGTHGTDCAETGDAGCAAGYGCYSINWSDGSETTECRQICVFTVRGEPAANTCAVGTCHEWLDPGAVIGDVEYGTCW
ncbi:MAG TPA: hypothetical protein VFU21_27300 [Kofleriaceae bacterium]|nr:hypothetical protein [Kofleriaceae bacterium]